MWIKARYFNIIYHGNIIKVKSKLSDNNDLLFLVDLPSGLLKLKLEFDENELSYWVQVPHGRTDISEEIGKIIEGLEN